MDLKRRAVYVATGNGYTQPADEASDAVIAYDLDTGRRLWVKQVMAADAYVRDCPGIYRPNVPTANKSETCPDDLGPDMDFGNAPILRTLPNGRSLIVIGQKDGHAWGLDPDRKGEVVWSRQLGLGWENGGGGMMWGSAADNQPGVFSGDRDRRSAWPGRRQHRQRRNRLACETARRRRRPRHGDSRRGVFRIQHRNHLRVFDE